MRTFRVRLRLGWLAMLAVLLTSELVAEPVLELELRQRSVASELVLLGDFGSEVVLSEAKAPAGYRFELFEVEARWAGEASPGGLEMARVTVHQGGKPARDFLVAIDSFGMKSRTTDLPGLMVPKRAGGTARVRFACLLREGEPVEVRVGNQTPALPEASTEAFRVEAPRVELQARDWERRDAVETPTRPSGARLEQGRGEIVVGRGGFRRAVVEWTVVEADGTEAGASDPLFAPSGYFVLVDARGAWHAPVAMTRREGGAGVGGISVSMRGRGGYELFWRERPELEGARLVFLPEEWRRVSGEVAR